MKNFIFTLSVDTNTPRLDLTETEGETTNEYTMTKNEKGEFTMIGRDKKLLFQRFLREIMPKETQALLFDPFEMLLSEKAVNISKPEDDKDWSETLDDNWLDELEQIPPDTEEYEAETEDEDCPLSPTKPDAQTPLSASHERRLRMEIASKLENDYGIVAESASEVMDAGIAFLRKYEPEQITDDLVGSAVEKAVDEILDKGFGMGDIILREDIEKEFSFPEQGETTVYTDGSCFDDSVGGWAAVIRCRGHKKELSGGERDTTSSRMELMGAVKALEFLNENYEITLFSDSRYVVDGINKGTAYSCQQNGWQKNDGSLEPNADLWEQLFALLEQRRVKFCWVKGHKGVADNERCDRLASDAAIRCGCTKFR